MDLAKSLVFKPSGTIAPTTIAPTTIALSSPSRQFDRAMKNRKTKRPQVPWSVTNPLTSGHPLLKPLLEPTIYCYRRPHPYQIYFQNFREIMISDTTVVSIADPTHCDQSTYNTFVGIRAATTGTCIIPACTRCPKKAPSSSSYLFESHTKGCARGKARAAFRFRCPPRNHGTTTTDRLSLVFLDRGRIFGRYTPSNRIVRSLNQGDHIPSIALPRVIETSAIQADSNGSSAGDSLCPVPPQPSCTPAQSFLPNPLPKLSWTTDESELPLLFDVNPKQGSTSGGDEIYLIVKNLPSNVVLYARFGDNIAPTCHIADGVLSCCLPAAARSGVVDVTLCQAPSVHEDSYGKSLVSFGYEVNSSKAAALLLKLLDGTFSTQAMRLMHGSPNCGTQEPTTPLDSGPIHSESVPSSALPESAFLEILSTLKGLPDFQQRLSRVNEHRQSLLHLAIHLRYRELFHRLVDWGIDLNIKDVNGFTPLHAAYLCGDASITCTLEQHDAVQLSLDGLGRPPIELSSGYTKTAEGCNKVVQPVWQSGHQDGQTRCVSWEWTQIALIEMGVPHNKLQQWLNLCVFQQVLQGGWDPREEIERHHNPFFEYLGDRRFRCIAPMRDGRLGEVCGWEGAKRDRTTSHICGHLGYNAWVCEGQCGRIGCTQKLEQHAKANSVQCSKCGKVIKHQRDLKKHIDSCR